MATNRSDQLIIVEITYNPNALHIWNGGEILTCDNCYRRCDKDNDGIVSACYSLDAILEIERHTIAKRFDVWLL